MGYYSQPALHPTSRNGVAGEAVHRVGILSQTPSAFTNRKESSPFIETSSEEWQFQLAEKVIENVPKW